MKTIKKTRESYYDVFVANDGTEFTNADECKKYEESAIGVLNALLRKMLVKDCTEEDIFGFGSGDNTIEIYRPSGENDKKNLLQMYLIVNTHLQDNEHYHYVERAEAFIDRAIAENDYLFVGRGYEYDCFYFIGTRHSMQEQLTAFCEKKEEENA